MKYLSQSLLRLALAAALTISLTATAVARPDPASPPPAPRVEPTAPAGQVWIPGHWSFSGRSWIWVDGWAEPERPGYSYLPGTWAERDGRWVWLEGRWRKRPSVNARQARAIPASMLRPCERPAGERASAVDVDYTVR